MPSSPPLSYVSVVHSSVSYMSCHVARVLEQVSGSELGHAEPDGTVVWMFALETVIGTPTDRLMASATRCCWSPVNPGNIGSDRISLATRSVTGKLPAPYPHSR